MARKAPAPPRYEGSKADNQQDRHSAGLLGLSTDQYEQHPMDRAQDIIGQRRLNAAVALKHAATAAVAHHSGGKTRRK